MAYCVCFKSRCFPTRTGSGGLTVDREARCLDFKGGINYCWMWKAGGDTTQVISPETALEGSHSDEQALYLEKCVYSCLEHANTAILSSAVCGAGSGSVPNPGWHGAAPRRRSRRLGKQHESRPDPPAETARPRLCKFWLEYPNRPSSYAARHPRLAAVSTASTAPK